MDDYYNYNDNASWDSDESEIDANKDYIKKLDDLNENRKRKKTLTVNDFCLKYNDDMWYIWCIVNDYSKTSGLLNQLDFTKFCDICYENSSKF